MRLNGANWEFQSTPPARGGDRSVTANSPKISRFQSTPPARGGDFHRFFHCVADGHFNPRPREGGRPHFRATSESGAVISIHAPREGGRRPTGWQSSGASRISIHAPREGGDPAEDDVTCMWFWISIHAPRTGGDSEIAQRRDKPFVSSAQFCARKWEIDRFPGRDRCFLLEKRRADPVRTRRANRERFSFARRRTQRISGSSGRYVCLAPKCSILFS